MRPIASFIACSEDGFIATPEGDISFLDRAALDGEDYGYAAFKSQVDTVLVGRKTYEKVASLGFPDPHPECALVVFSRQAPPADWAGSARRRWTSEDPVRWAQEARAQQGGVLYCDGGAELLHQLLQAGLVHRWIITTVPVRLEVGIPLLDRADRLADFSLEKTDVFPNGVVQRTYRKKQP